MGNPYLPRESLPRAQLVRDADLRRRTPADGGKGRKDSGPDTQESRRSALDEATEASSEHEGTWVDDPLFPGRRIRLPNEPASLPRRTFRDFSRLRGGVGDPQLESWFRQRLAAKHRACAVCWRIHTEEVDWASLILGWSCLRVRQYEQKAWYRARKRVSDFSYVAGKRYLDRRFPFYRRPGERDDSYNARMDTLARKAHAFGSISQEEAWTGRWYR